MTQVTVAIENSHIDFKKLSKDYNNRMLKRYGAESFLIVKFDGNVQSTTIRTILQNGLRVNSCKYHFLGCSSSGLKERTCYLYRGSVKDVDKVISECGSFSSIKSASTMLKRIGLLFSTALPTAIEIPNENVCEEDDVEIASGNFTDGCGALSINLATQIRMPKGLPVDTDYLPSVYQIRYQGCKGVVMVDPRLKGQCLLLRPSMKKFDPGSKPFRELWLCDQSKPYTFGHLNRQFIMLLSSLGVKDEVFLRIQEEHFRLLKTMKTDPTSAFTLLQFDNQPDLAYRTELLSGKVLSDLRKKLVRQLDKLRLLIPDSRNVFGVCDPTGKLQYGECFFRYTERGLPKTLCGSVVVAKNPCYLLGDVRVLKCVSVPGLDHLVDCIVFPIQGDRPHPSEIAGSDLDGDQYFVCWDEGLIVLHTHEPYDYPSISAPETTSEVNRCMLIDYFAGYRSSMGKIDAYYKEWAGMKGAGCPECQDLGKLFSRSVDASKTGDLVSIPDRLKPCSSESPAVLYVWEEMDKRVEEMKLVLAVQDEMKDSVAIDENFVWSILQGKYPNMSHYQLFRFLIRWCSKTHSNTADSYHSLEKFAKYLNFGEFTVDQQVEAIDAGIPLEIITNDLNKSLLFPPSLLTKFLYYDPHKMWKFYFHSSYTDFNWKHFLRGIKDHPESLMIVRLSEEGVSGVTFVIHFLKPPEFGENKIVHNGSIAVYFSSAHFNFDEQRIIGSLYTLDLTEQTLQLYRGKKGGTFVWMGIDSRSPNQSLRISVDLTRFSSDVLSRHNHPKVKKEGVSSVEVFVKSHSLEPAYLDVVEGPSVQIGQLSISEDVEELPIDTEDEDLCSDCSEIRISESCSKDALISKLIKSAKKGQIYTFQVILGNILTSERNAIPEVLKSFMELLDVVIKKVCHKGIDESAIDCLQVLITSLANHITNPVDSLRLLSRICLCHLGHWNLASFTLEQILSKTCTVTLENFLYLASSWRLWYFVPLHLSSKLVEQFYALFSSKLCSESAVHETSELVTPTSAEVSDCSLQQCGVQYTSYFAFRLLNNLLIEMANPDLDVELSRMKAYKPDSTNEDAQEEMDQKYTVGFSRTSAGLSGKITQGSYVTIKIIKKDKSQQVPVAIGMIVKLSRHPADILVEVEHPVPNCLKRSAKFQKGHWQLGFVANITNYVRSLKALKIIVQNPSSIRICPTLIYSHTQCLHSECKAHKDNGILSTTVGKIGELDLEQVNKDQEEAVKGALYRTISLIHGPPGTGKTHVACKIIQQYLAAASRCPILVTAETNLAVDNLCERLLPLGIRVVRIGRLDQISRNIRKISLEGQMERKRIEEGRDKSRSQFLNHRIVKQIVEAAQVVAATCTGAGDPAIDKMKFPFVIIDEATQVTEPSSLIPLSHGCQQLTLIGDPEQLGPMNIAESHQSIKAEELKMKSDLSCSLFHRLQKIIKPHFLSEQHRMHPQLAAFPSQKFYGGKLKNGTGYQLENCCKEIRFFNHPCPLIFLDICKEVHSREKREGTSFCNKLESIEVTNVVRYLIECQVNPREVAVLTPYSKQAKSVSECLELERLPHVNVSSIDGFQGREVDYVIFTTVRCNERGELGFVDDRYRVNVLLTRARHGIIGVGCQKTLLHSELWKDWLQGVNICGSIEERVRSLQPKQCERKGRHSKGHHQYASKRDSYCQQSRATERDHETPNSRNAHQGRSDARDSTRQQVARGGSAWRGHNRSAHQFQEGSSGVHADRRSEGYTRSGRNRGRSSYGRSHRTPMREEQS